MRIIAGKNINAIHGGRGGNIHTKEQLIQGATNKQTSISGGTNIQSGLTLQQTH